MKALKMFWVLIIVTLIVSISGCTSTQNFQVGTSTFTAPSEYKVNQSTNTSEESVTWLETGDKSKSISVTEFANNEAMTKELTTQYTSSQGATYYTASTIQVGDVTVKVFNDNELPFINYFFVKNGKCYMVNVKFESMNAKDNAIATQVINSLK